MQFTLLNSVRQISYGANDHEVEAMISLVGEPERSLVDAWKSKTNTTLSVQEAKAIAKALKNVIYMLIEKVKESPLPRLHQKTFLEHKIPFSLIYEEDSLLNFCHSLYIIMLDFVQDNEDIAISFDGENYSA